ncbi:hypothetical protein ACGE0T_12580 [Parabacteroides sp. APC149_11_2_Y6]
MLLKVLLLIKSHTGIVFHKIYEIVIYKAAPSSQAVGVNPSLMRKYKEGLAFASEKQKAAIQDKFKEIVTKMSMVQL